MLCEILFTENHVAEGCEVFASYYNDHPGHRLTRAFLGYYGYHYLVHGQTAGEKIFQIMEIELDQLENARNVCALDPRTTRAILDLLKKVNRELGITIVVITHEMQVIKDICDRVAVMKDGRVVETGTVFDIFANPKEQITREFVENTSNMSRIYELVETKSPVVELKPGEAILRFRYLERNVSEALVSQLSRKFNLDLNIIFGSIELIGENPIGGLVVIAQGTSDNINQAIQYLQDKNVGVEVILDGRTA